MRHWAVMDEVIKLQSSYNLGSLIRCWIKRLVSSFEAIFMTLSLCHSFWCQKIIDLSFSQISLSGFFFFLCWSGLCHCCLHTYCAPSNHQMCKCLMFKHSESFFFHAGVPEEGDGRGVWRGGCTKQPGSQSTPHKDVDALKDNQEEGWPLL